MGETRRGVVIVDIFGDSEEESGFQIVSADSEPEEPKAIPERKTVPELTLEIVPNKQETPSVPASKKKLPLN